MEKQIYIAADLDLYNKNIKNPDLNKIIAHWNESISDEDYVVIIGSLGTGKYIYNNVMEILKQLKGKKYYTDKSPKGMTNYKWKEAQVRKLRVDLFQNTTKGKIWVTNYDKKINDTDILVCGKAVLKNELYKNNKLNAGIKFWDYYPINLNSVEQMIEDFKLYDNMSNEVEENV